MNRRHGQGKIPIHPLIRMILKLSKKKKKKTKSQPEILMPHSTSLVAHSPASYPTFYFFVLASLTKLLYFFHSFVLFLW